MVKHEYPTNSIGSRLLLAAISQTAAERPGDEDRTPVTRCDDLPSKTSIEVFSKVETAAVCKEMLRILEGVTVTDLRNFSKAAFLLSAKGYKEGDYSQIARELVDILRLRGLYDQRSRWFPTIDLIYRSWIAFNGIIGPREIQEFLRAAGPQAAKALSDDGFQTAIVVMKNLHQRGDD
jgi:hypothetical protein